MRINKKFYIFFLMLFTWVTPIYAAGQNDPVTLLRSVADNMIAGLKANKATLKTKPQIVYNLANKYVVPYADLTMMSKHVLPPHVWNSATPTQRAQFQKEFTTTLIRTYATALSSYRDQSIRFYPVRGGYQGSGSIEVSSEIMSSEHEPIRVSYRLMRVANSWRLYDLSVEGVSMLESFRAQFADILSQGNMDQLLRRLSSHNQRSRG